MTPGPTRGGKKIFRKDLFVIRKAATGSLKGKGSANRFGDGGVGDDDD